MKLFRVSGLSKIERQLIAQAEDLARKGMWEECSDLEKRISTIRSVRLASLRIRTRATWLIAMFILVLTLALWAIRIPNPNAAFKVDSLGATLAFSAPTIISANMILGDGRHGGSGLSQIVLTQEGADGKASDRMLPAQAVRIANGAGVRLAELRFASASAATFSATKDGCFDVILLRGQLSATFSANKTFKVLTETSSGQVENDGDTLLVEGAALAQRPRIKICPAGEAALKLANLSAVSFETDESLATSGALLASTISTGELLFPQTATKLQFTELEALAISGIDPISDARLTIGREAVQFRFSGRASSFAVSGGGVRRDVRPTALAYLVKSNSLALVFAGIGMLWGAIWTVLRIVRED